MAERREQAIDRRIASIIRTKPVLSHQAGLEPVDTGGDCMPAGTLTQ